MSNGRNRGSGSERRELYFGFFVGLAVAALLAVAEALSGRDFGWLTAIVLGAVFGVVVASVWMAYVLVRRR